MPPIITTIVIVSLAVTTTFAQVGSWQVLPNSPVALDRWDAMHFVHQDSGCIAGTKSGVFRTRNAGETWEELTSAYYSPTDKPYFRSMGWANSRVGWLGALGGKHQIYHTVDGGDSWTRYAFPTGSGVGGICGIQAIDESTAYFVGPFMNDLYGKPHFTSTRDGGQNYTTLDLSALSSTMVDVNFVDGAIGVVGGGVNGAIKNGFATVLHTQDSGRTWKTVYTSTKPGTQLWKFSMSTDGVIAGAVQAFGATTPYVIFSRDSGQTWTESSIAIGTDLNLTGLQSVGLLSSEYGWVGGRLFSSRSTTNGGKSWQQDSSVLRSVNRFQFFSDTLGYASGAQVYVYRRGSTTHTEDDGRLRGTPNADLRVSNSGPGVIEISLPTHFVVQNVSLYDMQGRELAHEAPSVTAQGTMLLRHSLRSGVAIVVVCTDIDCLSGLVAIQ
ncbi:MAG: hypothetical protein IPI24_02495 [Ignavibacteria bacterium]|nr:hypothetical protein [Ignavibacteria bacterium]MBL0323115.1 hypothetical protein [Ignavibacteria bacterium]